jgi:hypothetical protein
MTYVLVWLNTKFCGIDVIILDFDKRDALIKTIKLNFLIKKLYEFQKSRKKI